MLTAFNLGNKQQNRIRNLVMEAYKESGISPDDSRTWATKPPTLWDVWKLYLAQEKVEEDSLYAALDDLISFEIFETDPLKVQSLYDLVSGVVGEHFLVGVMRTVDGKGNHQWSVLKAGLNMFSFRLDTMPGKCESDEKVIGLQIGVRGEFCGTMDDFNEFRDLAMRMSGVWAIRRVAT